MLNFSDLGTSEKQVQNKIFTLNQKNISFTLTETTGTSTIEYWNQKRVKEKFFYRHDVYGEEQNKMKTDYNPNIVPTICRAVLADIKKFLAAGNPMPFYDRKNEQFFTRSHHPQLVKTIQVRDIIHEVDINKFYWTEAYNRGWISEKTYKKYMRFKHARLIALGNLAKTTVKKVYVEGKIMAEESSVSPYAPFFYNLMYTGYKIHCEASKATDHKIFYFQTDAFYVQPSNHIKQKIKEVLDKHKHEYKVIRHKVKERSAFHVVLENLDTKKCKQINFYGDYE